MPRLASVLGVAAVATAVLLSGCEMETDYAKKLEGTWVSHRVDRDIALDPAMPTDLTSVTTTVKVMFVDGDGLNSGEFTLTVSNTLQGTDQAVPGLSISGSLEVDAEEITATIKDVKPSEAAALIPADVRNEPQTLQYDLTFGDTKLTVSGRLVPALLAPEFKALAFDKE